KIMLASHKDVAIEPLGVQKWDYEQGSYKVTRDYRVKAPEADMDVSVQVVSTEGEDSEGRRKWFVFLPKLLPTNLQPTQLGQAMQATRMQARTAAEHWMENARKGKIVLPDVTEYEKIAPPNMPRDLIKQSIAALMAGRNADVRGM